MRQRDLTEKRVGQRKIPQLSVVTYRRNRHQRGHFGRKLTESKSHDNTAARHLQQPHNDTSQWIQTPIKLTTLSDIFLLRLPTLTIISYKHHFGSHAVPHERFGALVTVLHWSKFCRMPILTWSDSRNDPNVATCPPLTSVTEYKTTHHSTKSQPRNTEQTNSVACSADRYITANVTQKWQ